MNEEKRTYLEQLYFDPKLPASYSGLNKLYAYIRKEDRHRITRRQLKTWLSKQEAYSLHRQNRHKFKRLRVITPEVDYQWDCDLAVLINLSKHNGGTRYFLLAVDIFSRYVWTRPLKSKGGEDVTEAFRSIFQEGRIPQKIRSDKGKEFTSKTLLGFLQSKGVESFTAESDVKAGYSERAIKTIKAKIYKYMTRENTFKWVSALQQITESYNGSVHRSIKMAPESVNEDNTPRVWRTQYTESKPNAPTTYEYEVGDAVRLSHTRYTFKREYNERWTREVFLITERKMKENIPCYKLKDFQNEAIAGTFYRQELQKAEKGEDVVYKIEKVITTRRRRGKREMLVKWLGWGQQFNSWIPEEQVQDLNEG